jgi:N-methylhydantoinase A
LVTFGGSGSLLACRLLELLSLPLVLVPPNPGNVSAYGLLTVDVRNDVVRTAVATDRELDLTSLAAAFDELTGQARQALSREGFPVRSQVIERSADLRYLGQAYEVRVACPAGPPDRGWADAVVDGFHTAHRALYGYDFRGKAEQSVEWVNLRVAGIGPIPRPVIAEIAASEATPPAGSRQVYFGGWLAAAIYDRADLLAGDIVRGPAVVQEFGSTVPIEPGFLATVDQFGNLLITKERADG